MHAPLMLLWWGEVIVGIVGNSVDMIVTINQSTLSPIGLALWVQYVHVLFIFFLIVFSTGWSR